MLWVEGGFITVSMADGCHCQEVDENSDGDGMSLRVRLPSRLFGAKDMAGNDVANFNFELWRLHVWRTMKTMANGEGSAPTEMPVQYRRKSLNNSNSIHRGKAIAKR